MQVDGVSPGCERLGPAVFQGGVVAIHGGALVRFRCWHLTVSASEKPRQAKYPSRRGMRQAAPVEAVALAPQTAPGRQGPRRVASPGRPITRSGRGPRAGAARWMEDRGRMVDGNEAHVLGRAGDRSGIGEDGGTKRDGPVAIALGHDGRPGRKRDGRVSGAERPGAGRRPRRRCLVVGWEHRPAQDLWIEGEFLRGCLRPRSEVVCRTAGSGRGGRGAEKHEERQDRPEPQRHRGSLGRGSHCCTGFGRTNSNGSGTRDSMTAADVDLLDRLTRLIEEIAAIKDLRCRQSFRERFQVAAAHRGQATCYVKLMMTDLICVKRSRPYGPFSRPQPLCLKPPHGEALSNAL